MIADEEMYIDIIAAQSSKAKQVSQNSDLDYFPSVFVFIDL